MEPIVEGIEVYWSHSLHKEICLKTPEDLIPKPPKTYEEEQDNQVKTRSMNDTALEDITVLDLSNYIAGPYCCKLLADYGAEVIKIEHPEGGDLARRMGPFPQDVPDAEKSGLFLFLNTNKLGVTLNLNTAAGRSLFKELVQDADILVESFKPAVMSSLGLGYEELRKINPKLIMTSISNFGQSGPYKDYNATEIVLAAMGGNMFVSGDYDRGPLMHGIPISQFLGGLNGLIGSLVALHYQRETGRGQHVDVSLMDSVVSSLPYAINYYSYVGAIWRNAPKEKTAFGPWNLWPAKDGYVGMTIIRSTDMSELAAFLEIPELADPKFSTPEGWHQYAAQLKSLVLPILKRWEKVRFFEEGHQWRFMNSAVFTPTEILENKQLQERKYFQELDHPLAGKLPYPREVLGLTETPAHLVNSAPRLGQNNEDVFCGRLGYTKADLVRLRQTMAI